MLSARPIFLAALLAVGSAGRPMAAAVPARPYGLPAVTTYGVREIGSNPAAYCLGQGPEGTLVAGGGGLLTFDGDRWAVATAPGLQAVYSLDFAPDGRLWAAADGEVGWFARGDDGAWNYTSLSPQLQACPVQGQVWRIFGAGQGAVFVTADTIYRWDGSHLRWWSMTGAPRLTAFRLGGRIYIGHSPTGIYRLDEDGPHLVVAQHQIGSTRDGLVLYIDERSDSWLVVTAEGLVEVRDGRGTPIAPGTGALLAHALVTSGVRLPDHRYAFGTLNGGIVITDENGALEEQLGAAAGVAPNIFAVFVDASGQLWSASPAGVQRVNMDPNTRVFDQRSGLPVTAYRSIAASPDAVLATCPQGVWELDDAERRFFAADVYGHAVHDVTRAAAGFLIATPGRVWLRSHGGATVILNGRNDYQLAVPSREPGEFLVADHDRAIDAVVAGKLPSRVVHSLPVAGTSLAEDPAGKLWIGTDTQGVFVASLRAGDGPPRRPGAEFGLPVITGPAMVRNAGNGDVFVLCDGRGWVMRAGRKQFTAIVGYPSRSIAAVGAGLENGSIWVAHGADGASPAVVAMITADAVPQWIPHSIPDLDAIGSPTSLTAVRGLGSQTVLWLGGDRAIMRHVVASGAAAIVPRRPLLRAYMRDADGIRHRMPANIPYETTGIEFEFSDPEFATRASNRLETRIVGVQDRWLPSGPEARRELTGLRDGHFRFEVRVVSGAGLASAPAGFDFTVAPPWWRTPAALLSAMLVLGSGIVAGYHIRVRALRRRNAELERKVRERTAELAQASAAKTEFVANMSHDIRNPLSGIAGLTLALENEALEPKERQRIVATLRECTTYLSSLVEDILDFARIESGRIELKPKAYAPSELLNAVVTALQPDCARINAFVTIELDPEVPSVLHGDAGRIQQILVNFVSNALKYAAGDIRISVGLNAAAPGQVEYAVTDRGPGISRADQAALFLKFSRLPDARRSQIPGTGLGLASCKVLATAMGGSVGVESGLGQGARFFLRVPLTTPKPVAITRSPVKLPATTVLLVEDAEYNALAAQAVLAKLGLSCDHARSGSEGIERFRDKRHHIVLLDRNLPDMDGTDVARRMRGLETDGRRSLLLAVTAYCTVEDRRQCLDAGMDAFVGKPLTPEKLRETLLAEANRLVVATEAAPRPSSSPSAQAAATVELTLLEYLATDSAGLKAQIDRFLNEINAAHAALLGTPRTDRTALRNAAHKLLGHARMVNAAPLSQLVIDLEEALKTRTGDVDRLLDGVSQAVEVLARTLRKHE